MKGFSKEDEAEMEKLTPKGPLSASDRHALYLEGSLSESEAEKHRKYLRGDGHYDDLAPDLKVKVDKLASLYRDEAYKAAKQDGGGATARDQANKGVYDKEMKKYKNQLAEQELTSPGTLDKMLAQIPVKPR